MIHVVVLLNCGVDSPYKMAGISITGTSVPNRDGEETLFTQSSSVNQQLRYEERNHFSLKGIGLEYRTKFIFLVHTSHSCTEQALASSCILYTANCFSPYQERSL